MQMLIPDHAIVQVRAASIRGCGLLPLEQTEGQRKKRREAVGLGCLATPINREKRSALFPFVIPKSWRRSSTSQKKLNVLNWKP